ncbi:MAG: RluA family pseudouridine synthase [Planctomycetes bacterium]|nr:RluA family pseudouridine synthase [Planctomycetota bacterium]
MRSVPIEIEILHEDALLVAVAKPAGAIVVPGRGPAGEECLRDAVARHAGGRIWVVHRLDREASGAVLFAKDPGTHRALSIQFEKRQVKKTYLALVQGRVAGDGEIDRPLREFGSGKVGVAADGKASLTRYRVQKRFRGATLLVVEPASGRRHQIRVHLYSIGHPVMGDTRYGEDRPVGRAGRLMLHALEIVFSHPTAGPMTVACEPGPDFTGIIGAL